MELEVVLDAPVERVFAFLADPENRPRWQSSLRRVELITNGAPRVGTRWREAPIGLGWVELEIVRFERDRAWSERAELAFGAFTLTLRFTPEGAATRVHVDAELALRGAARLLGSGARLVLPRAFASDLRRAGRILARER
jgi:uncharacterized protein YndB with AHSA1/START domain